MRAPQLGVTDDLAHLRAHVRLQEVAPREAMQRLIAIARASAHALVDQVADRTEEPEQTERVADELERTLAVITGQQ